MARVNPNARAMSRAMKKDVPVMDSTGTGDADMDKTLRGEQGRVYKTRTLYGAESGPVKPPSGWQKLVDTFGGKSQKPKKQEAPMPTLSSAAKKYYGGGR